MAAIADEAGMWLQLMETGVFDDCYPQRLNACFHYLSQNMQTFALKDFIQKAPYVFSYLSLDAEKDSNFAAIDVFRMFDRSGTSQIALEDFLLGIIEHIHTIRRDIDLLDGIAEALLSVESRAIELSTLLEKGNNRSSKFSKFNANLGAISSIIRSDIKLAKKLTPVLSKGLLVAIFQRALSQAVSDVQTHFHLSSGRMSTLLLTITPEESKIEVQPLPVVWGLKYDKKTAPPAGRAMKEDEPPGSNKARSRSNSIVGGSPEDVLASFLSSLDENRLKTLHHAPSMSNATMNALGALGAMGGLGMGGMSAVGMGGMNTMGMGGGGHWEDATLLPQGLLEGMDSNKLFLLQQAFQSLNSFFTLFSSITSGVAGAGKVSNTLQVNQHFHIHNNFSPGADGHSVHSQAANANAAAPSPSGVELLGKLKEYREILLGPQGDGASAIQQQHCMDGVEFLLAEDLFDSQTTLANLSTKCHILEMIQSDQLLALQQKARRKARRGTRARGGGRGGTSSSDSSSDSDDSASSDSETNPRDAAQAAPSFEDILGELSCLGTQLSARTTSIFPLGMLLDNKYVTLQPNNQIFASLYQIEQMSYEVLENLYKFQSFQFNVDKLARDLQLKDQHVKELVHRQESFNFERNDLVTSGLELQILKDKLNKHARDDNLHRLLENKNLELSKRVQELEDQLQLAKAKAAVGSAGESSPTRPGQASSSSAVPAVDSLKPSGPPAGASQDVTTLVVDAQNVQALIASSSVSDVDKVRKLGEYIAALHQQGTNLAKENNKVHTSVAYYEKRLKACISDQMVLHNSIYALEDEITMYKSTITKLTREVEDGKAFKLSKEDHDRALLALQKELSKCRGEVAEANNNLLLANKYHNDLIHAERTIEGLEHKVSECNIELEKGQVAQAQLESFRDQLKQRSKEIRDMSLHVHGLETQLKEVPYLNQRYQETLAELQDTKSKVEKVPGLLAEIARLRGSARASIKALSEQDKMLNVFKGRVKALEKETTLLKHDNRALQDVENKLKESNNEVKRLMTQLAEANNGNKVGAGPEERGKEASAGLNKKMQRYMRQSAFFATNPLSPSTRPGGASEDTVP